MTLDQSDRATVEKLKAKLAPLEAEAAPLLAAIKQWQVAINMIHEAAGASPPYQIEPSAAVEKPSLHPVGAYGRAEFFGKPLATVATQILTDHDALDIDELYDLMVSGGFDFGGKPEAKAKNSLKISLGKNVKFGRTAAGHYVVNPNGVAKPRRQQTGQAPVDSHEAPPSVHNPDKEEEERGGEDNPFDYEEEEVTP